MAGRALTGLDHRPLSVEVPTAAAATARDYAQLLAAQLPEDLRSPIVVAHSGAGILLPALAEHTGAVHQVWTAAAVADYHGGRSFRSEIRHDPAAIFHPEWVGVDPTTDTRLAATSCSTMLRWTGCRKH